MRFIAFKIGFDPFYNFSQRVSPLFKNDFPYCSQRVHHRAEAHQGHTGEIIARPSGFYVLAIFQSPVDNGRKYRVGKQAMVGFADLVHSLYHALCPGTKLLLESSPEFLIGIILRYRQVFSITGSREHRLTTI